MISQKHNTKLVLVLDRIVMVECSPGYAARLIIPTHGLAGYAPRREMVYLIDEDSTDLI